MKILVTGAYGQLGNEIKEFVRNFPIGNFYLPMLIRWILQMKMQLKIFFKKES